MASAIALVVTKERHSLDSRFAWSSSLGDNLATAAPVIVYHNSVDSEEDTVGFLTQLYKAAPNKKFIYIHNEVNPLIASVFYGIGGIVCDDLFPLSSNEVLLAIIDEYTKSDFIVKQPVEQFTELQQAMMRILNNDLDEDQLHEILTNPDWLRQVKASMSTVHQSLIQVKETNTQLTTYVNNTRSLLNDMRVKYSEVREELTKALKAQTVSTVSEGGQNIITKYPAVNLPASAERVLYIKCISPCAYLLSFLLAYQLHLSTELSIQSRILVIKPDTKRNRNQYTNTTGDGFYLLHNASLNTQTNKKAFVTFEPKKNVIDYFFNDPKAKLFIVLDDFQSDILIRGTKMKTLYASGSINAIKDQNISPQKVFCSVGGPVGSFILPHIAGYTEKTTPSARAGAYYSKCKDLFDRLDTINGFDVM